MLLTLYRSKTTVTAAAAASLLSPEVVQPCAFLFDAWGFAGDLFRAGLLDPLNRLVWGEAETLPTLARARARTGNPDWPWNLWRPHPVVVTWLVSPDFEDWVDPAIFTLGMLVLAIIASLTVKETAHHSLKEIDALQNEILVVTST